MVEPLVNTLLFFQVLYVQSEEVLGGQGVLQIRLDDAMFRYMQQLSSLDTRATQRLVSTDTRVHRIQMTVHADCLLFFK